MMKKLIFLSLTLFVLSSCKEKEVNLDLEILGSWELVDVNIDPGDGSGEWEEANYQKRINFLANNKVNSSGSLCRPGELTGPESWAGTYDITENTISSDKCQTGLLTRYEILDDKLILSFLCFEGCRERYVKTN